LKVELNQPVREKQEILSKQTGLPSVYPDLLQELKKVRYDLAIKENVPAYIIFSDSTLVELASYLPLTEMDLAKISGFGDVKLARYGKTFLNVVQEYCKHHQLPSKIQGKINKNHRSKPAKENPSDSRRLSLKLFKEGKSIREIAAMRQYVDSTIEGHLASFIASGEIDIYELIPESRVIKILEVVKQVGGYAALPIKEELGEEYSYGEIRTVMTYHRWLQLKEA
jgi:ATP-dependent DNA helicase RecQ